MSETNPTVSVLMPVYNSQRYVAAAIESILGQTFADFEFLIVDDGSADKSRKILESYAARDDRIKLVSRPNTGYVIALNEMIGRAQGEFLARMDSDDIARPQRFERQVAFLREHPDVLCVGGFIQEIDERGWLLIESRPPAEDGPMQETALEGRSPVPHPTAMIRADAVRAVGGYRTELWPAEDLDLWLRLGERGRLANLAEIVLDYRVHHSSVSSRHHARQLAAMRQACEEAYARRGLDRQYISPAPFRPGLDSSTRRDTFEKYGWWSFMGGRRKAALWYGSRAVALQPWRASGWRLLACALLKTTPPPGPDPPCP